jgi:predicted lipoprotein
LSIVARTRIPERSRWKILTGWLAGAVVVLALFPPFHFRSLHAVGAAHGDTGAVDVPGFAERFWNAKLVSPGVPPVEAHPLVAALVQDPALAAEKYGRRAGVGGKTFFLVSGAGRVAAVDHTGVWIDVRGAADPRVLLLTGPVFGNALRDVTGLLNLTDYSSVDFNSLSAALNHLCETRAQPALHRVGVGASISFLAAGEIDDASQAEPVLRLAPIRVEVQP